jgi:hypothetical protein
MNAEQHAKKVASQLLVTELVLIHPADAIPFAKKLMLRCSQSNRNIPIA